jgi:hypothetical protein
VAVNLALNLLIGPLAFRGWATGARSPAPWPPRSTCSALFYIRRRVALGGRRILDGSLRRGASLLAGLGCWAALRALGPACHRRILVEARWWRSSPC